MKARPSSFDIAMHQPSLFTMNSPRFLLSGFLFATSALAVESVLPVPFPAERYASIVEKSPFSLATPPAPPPAEQAKGFASDYYVTGLATVDQKDFVSIKSRDLSTNFSLFGNEPNGDGIALVSVDWSKERGKSTVTIKKGTEFAKLEFNQAELQSVAAPMVPGQPGRPMLPGQPGIRPVVQPQQPMPVTGAAGRPVTQTAVSIPRPTNAPVFTAPPPLPNANGAPAGVNLPGVPNNANINNPAANQRRIRVINPKQ